MPFSFQLFPHLFQESHVTKDAALHNLYEYVETIAEAARRVNPEFDYDDIAVENRVKAVVEAVEKECADAHTPDAVFDKLPGITVGDYLQAKGAMLDATTDFIDWEKLHHGDPQAISPPGHIILYLINSLPK